MTRDWAELEAWLRVSFDGLSRKDGKPMVGHSIRVGQAVRRRGGDAVAVFGGYCHDVLEDTAVGVDGLLTVARAVLDDPASAAEAVRLVEECSYSQAEEALPKLQRKQEACARWSETDDRRVHLIKLCDVDDNRADAAALGEAFEQAYLAWALPLRERLLARLAR
jgi:(p)ppGpp synthase/HD superfamily hydrolase